MDRWTDTGLGARRLGFKACPDTDLGPDPISKSLASLDFTVFLICQLRLLGLESSSPLCQVPLQTATQVGPVDC